MAYTQIPAYTPYGQPSYQVQLPPQYTMYDIGDVPYAYYPGGYIGQPYPVPTPPAAPQQPPPRASGLALQTALGAIPIARDGDVITAGYHNAVRTALLQVAGFIGDDVTNQQATITRLPAFFSEEGQTPWRIVSRVAHQATSGTASHGGWMPIELPDGSRIMEIGAFAGRADNTATIDSFRVKLIRHKLSDGTTLDLGTLELKDQKAATFQKSLTLTGNDLDRTVDNLNFEYVILAELVNAQATAAAKLFAIQVRCIRW